MHQIDPVFGGTYFEFMPQKPLRLDFYAEFTPQPGRISIQAKLKTDGNNNGFRADLKQRAAGQAAASKSLPKGEEKSIVFTYDAPSPAPAMELHVYTIAKGKSWGTLGPVQICPK